MDVVTPPACTTRRVRVTVPCRRATRCGGRATLALHVTWRLGRRQHATWQAVHVRFHGLVTTLHTSGAADFCASFRPCLAPCQPRYTNLRHLILGHRQARSPCTATSAKPESRGGRLPTFHLRTMCVELHGAHVWGDARNGLLVVLANVLVAQVPANPTVSS